MDSTRKTALLAGILFIIADLVGIPGKLLSDPLVLAPNYLEIIAPNAGQIILAALLIFMMAVACAGISFAFYPVLKKHDPILAIGAVGFRIIESIFEVVAGIILLLLLSLSVEVTAGTSSDIASVQSIGRLLLVASDCLGNVVIQSAWCLGALAYSYVFYKARLLPRWLSVWGLVAYPLPIVAGILIMFGQLRPADAIWGALIFPAALQELGLAVWLIAKGFAPTATSSSSPST